MNNNTAFWFKKIKSKIFGKNNVKIEKSHFA